VQGVCFRYYTRQTAHQLGLDGWVKNQSDGSVAVLAEGPRDALDSLLAFLRKGPEGARVDHLSSRWLPYQGDLSDFRIAR
jgi:acylphosphatase